MKIVQKVTLDMVSQVGQYMLELISVENQE